MIYKIGVAEGIIKEMRAEKKRIEAEKKFDYLGVNYGNEVVNAN